jgi:hypothetical protein
VYTHDYIRVLKKYQNGIIHRKLKVLMYMVFSEPMIQYTLWACSGALRCSGASSQGDTRGTLDHRPDFWGTSNIRAPRQGSRGPHDGRYIMGGTSRGDRASTSYTCMHSADCGGSVSFIHSSFLFGPQPYSNDLIHANSLLERGSTLKTWTLRQAAALGV